MEPFVCTRCKHSWWPRRFDDAGLPIAPKVCPLCKSPYWNRPKKGANFEHPEQVTRGSKGCNREE